MADEPESMSWAELIALFRGSGDPSTPSAVRAILASLVPSRLPPSLLEDLQLIATELLTNALKAGADWIESELRLAEESVEISVYDDAPGSPDIHHPDLSEVAGRGLEIIEEIAEAWGFREGLDVGKTVWAIIRRS